MKMYQKNLDSGIEGASPLKLPPHRPPSAALLASLATDFAGRLYQENLDTVLKILII